MGFWPYSRHAHGSDDDTTPLATGISRTTFFGWLFLLLINSRKKQEALLMHFILRRRHQHRHTR
jgi:hypothetical protein